MTTTIATIESFVFAEMPVISGSCIHCGKSVKQSIDNVDQPIDLEIGYRIRTIYFFGGRSFEKVASEFVHACSSSMAKEPNGVGRVTHAELALL